MKNLTISLMVASVLTLVSCSTSTTEVENKSGDSTSVETTSVDSTTVPVIDSMAVVADSTKTK